MKPDQDDGHMTATAHARRPDTFRHRSVRETRRIVRTFAANPRVAVEDGEPVDLDSITAQWRIALNAADDALRAARASGLSSLGDAEQARRSRRLADERASVALVLEMDARENHLRLRRPLSAPRATTRMLGLPTGTRACLFDLDGVLTASAALHAAAWAHTFDELLGRRAGHAGALTHLVRPFDVRADYVEYLHGRPRLDGVRAFLASRGISLPEGRADDGAGAETVHGLANRKNAELRRLLDGRGVAAFGGSRRYLEAAREADLRCAVVSASANTAAILERAGLSHLIDERVDGEVMNRDRLAPKPAPDTLLAACSLVETPPDHAAAFETTIAGIAAARAAEVADVIAIGNDSRASALREAGAHSVVGDLTELLDSTLAA